MSQTADAATPTSLSERILQAATLKTILIRLISLGFLAWGLYQWSVLLGALHDGSANFFTLTLQAQAVVLFFAVANLVAAVGLWLNATWGAVVWFSAAAVRIVRHTVFASSLGWMPVATATETGLILAYLLLVSLDARARRLEIRRQRDSRRRSARE